MEIKYKLYPEGQNFEKVIDGKETVLITLSNKNEHKAFFTNYGARWVSMIVHNSNKQEIDVIAGFDSISGYLKSSEKYYGAVAGRYANRIAKGRFILNGKEYVLATNNAPNHLHGGNKGFNDVVWDVTEHSGNSVTMNYSSKDGEEGYPGNLEAEVKYTLTDADEIIVNFIATTDAPTIVNLTQHAYFNLNGTGSGDVLNHFLTIQADHYTPVDKTSIPSGSIVSVAGTPFDFTKIKRIGKDINTEDEQLFIGKGYDHNYVLNRKDEGMVKAAEAKGDLSEITMEVFTTEPGMQLYTGNFMNNENVFKGGFTDGKNHGFCLETQHYPDSPNQRSFPSVVLNPGEKYDTTTVFKFSVK